MAVFSANLRLVQGELCGRTWPWRPYQRIRPEDILEVREYCFGNALLEVRTKAGCYKIGAWRGHFDEIVSFIESNTRFRVSDTWTHRVNRLFYGTRA